jgi:clan AA aspartic protease (TIGR02281 family)
MKQLAFSACLLLVGLAAGWWLRELAGGEGVPPAHQDSSVPGMPVAEAVSAGQAVGGRDVSASLPEAREPAPFPDVATFEALLQQGAFERSIAYYEDAVQLRDSYRSLLKPSLEGYLRARAQDCSDGDFVGLVNLWLEAYYADTDVLLQLAEHQRLCSSSEEAARTLQIASTYAFLPGQREQVAAAVAALVAATDARLSRQQDWVTLLGFYEFLDVIDLETNASQLQRVSLYERLGEVQRGRDLLADLRARDDGLDAEWTAALDERLSADAPEPPADESPLFEIALTRHGNHYLVPAVINDDNRLTLMIDTGASVTALSQERFEQMDRARVRYLGSRLFNTPNAITRGELYRAASLQLGEARVSDIEIAVLEFEPGEGFDGLLGMNVLRNYRFEIDQDREVLELDPRQ